MKTKKLKPIGINSNELFQQHFKFVDIEDEKSEIIKRYAIDFARQKVIQALHETSEHFKNPENVSYIKNHYDLDKIV